MIQRKLIGALAAVTLSTIASAQSSNSGQIVQLQAQDIVPISQLLGPVVEGGSGIVRISPASFVAGSGSITFSEFPISTINPTYTPANYGGGAASPAVTFRGFFAGQALGTAATCPPGAAITGCVVGSATNPLTLGAAAPNTSIVPDSANPTSPVLSGTPTFNGSIAVLFNTNQAAVGLEGGFFDSIGGTAITAFRRDGTIIGSVSNAANGIEFLGLATSDRSESIAGLLFSLVGAEAAGFAIDNLRFGTAGQVVVGPPPAIATTVPVSANNPVALAALVLALGLIAGVAVRRYS